ncbi:NADH:flavin oxidoreductase [Labilithrix luteola]|nr:NADH:flavin oxidoreductase [Labilithrix luteola]
MDTNESRETVLLSSASVHPALAPTTIGPLSLRNRLAVAPMSRVSTLGDGFATARMRDYYASFARGGFGLVVTEGTYTDLAHSQAYGRQPGIATDAQAEAWAPIVRAVHEQGTAIVLQLMHAGALSQENGYRPASIGPSAVVPRGTKMSDYGGAGAYALPRAMTEEDIAEVVEGFARAAVRARKAGFDGVEIHGANGYLLDQFLTTYTNQRTDRWGGAVENRIRLTAEVVAASVRAAGAGFVVGVRVSQTKVNDLAYRWPGGSRDAAIVFEELRAAGADYVHLASEGADAAETARFADGGNVLEVARRVTGRPVIANGGLAEPSRLARLFREEQADLVALGRAALANPDWPLRLARGADFERFDRAMLHPFASLENAEQWRSRTALSSPR